MQSLPNLSPAITAEIFDTLCSSLPPPTAGTPEARAAGHETAMERAGYWFKDVSVPLPAPVPDRADQTQYDALTEAEQYAVIDPDRVALIRAHGGLPPNPGFGAPEPDIVEVLVNGTCPTLRALDAPRNVAPTEQLSPHVRHETKPPVQAAQPRRVG